MIGNFFAIDTENDISYLKSCLRCGQISKDILDINTIIYRNLFFCFESRSDIYILDTNDRSSDCSERFYGFDGACNEFLAYRQSERYPFSFSDSGGNTKDIAFDIKQRTTAISRIYECVSLIKSDIEIIFIYGDLFVFASDNT